MALPLKNYDPGFVDCVVHNLTGAQIIFRLMYAWKAHPSMPVVLWCRKGDAVHKMNAIRVALSRERKSRNIPRTFELEFSAIFPQEHMEIRGESVRVRKTKGTLLTQMRAVVFESKQNNQGSGGLLP